MGVEQLYFVANGAIPTTAAYVKVTTGVAIKTLLQLATPSNQQAKIVEWGISFDGSAAATPIEVEFFSTTVAATTGTSVNPTNYSDPNGPASLCVGGAALTCFSPTVEGTVANYRGFDLQLVAPTSQYVKQFPLGREPMLAVSQFARIRVTASAAVNAYCYIIWSE